MNKIYKKVSRKTGLPPGSLILIGEKKVDYTTITIMDYDDSRVTSIQPEKTEDLWQFRDSKSISWIDIIGLHDIAALKKIAEYYQINPLIMEDILNTQQRPKLDNLNDALFMTMKMIQLDEESNEVFIEQVSIILGKSYVITFQEKEGDVFEPVRQRILNAKSRLRQFGPDYLFYALSDVIVDHYFLIMEHFGENVESLEERVIDHPDQEIVQEIQWLKRDLIIIRRSIWPLREAISDLKRDDSQLITPRIQPYLDDMYDHIIQVLDTVDTLRDMAGVTLDIYLSNMSNKMNEIMKVLTIIATIFIPLTFLAGIYGMNFKFMPELQWKWGYPLFWILIGFIFLGLVLVFRKRKWL